MKKRSLARPTPSFKLLRLFAALLLFSFFLAGDLYAQVRGFSDLSPELLKRIEEAVETFQRPLPEKEYQGIIKKTEKSLPEGIKSSFQKREDKILYYFFSFSMPEEVTLGAMREALKLNRDGETKAVMILRGFVKNSLKETVRTFLGYLQKIGEDIPVEIAPELFQEFGILRVPVVIERKDKERGIIRGDQAGLCYALGRFGEGLKDYGLFGQLYPIEEEDLLKVISSKQKRIEETLREKLPGIKKKMLVLDRYDGKFEHAKKDRVYYIDPAIILSEDIYDHKGNVILRKGETFSPARYGIGLGRYVVIDGQSKKQVDFAMKGDFRKVILIRGNLGKLTRKYRYRFYFANDEILERFRIKRVPAVIEGEGRYVKVTEKAL
jgi:conjugal transfer pilus assembly protein TraW